MGQYLSNVDNYFQERKNAVLLFKKEYPDVQLKFDSYEAVKYQNVIDRTIYLIRLREFFHTKFALELGPDSPDKLTEYKVSERSFKPTASFTLDEHIRYLDQQLIKDIDNNLRTAKSLYQIGDSTIINNRPYASLMNDPNRLIISLFIFPIEEWFKMLQIEIQKLYGKRNTKKHLTRSDDVLQLKHYLRSLGHEIEERIGTHEFKLYEGTSGYAYHNVTNLELGHLLEKISINKSLGNLNYDDKLPEITKIQEDRSALSFAGTSKELYPIFKEFLSNYLGLKETKFRGSLKLFLSKHSISPIEIEKNWMDYKNVQLNFITDDNALDFCAFLRFLHSYNIANLKQNKTAIIFKKFTNSTYGYRRMRGIFTDSQLADSIKEDFLTYPAFKNLALKANK